MPTDVASGADRAVVGPETCGSAPRCVELTQATSMTVSPDGKQLYAFNWDPSLGPAKPENFGIYGLIAWNRRFDGTVDYRNPIACFSHPVYGPRLRHCPVARGWYKALEPEDELAYTPAPRSVVVSSDGHHVYATAGNSLSAFARDPVTGALRQLPGASGCWVRDLAAAPGCTRARAIRNAGRISFSPDGRNVYVPYAGPRTAGVAIFARDPDSGVLTQLQGERGCISSGLAGCARARQVRAAQDVVIAPDGRHAYVGATVGYFLRGGASTFARDPRDGSLTQLPGRRGCVNRSGRQGCLRDPSFETMDATVISTDGRSLYSTAYGKRHGPRRHPLGSDGRIRKSTEPLKLPIFNEDPEHMVADAEGRLYVAGHSFGLYVYAPAGRDRMRLAQCWTNFKAGPCHRARRSPFGYPGGKAIAPAPDGTVHVSGSEGLLTVRPSIRDGDVPAP